MWRNSFCGCLVLLATCVHLNAEFVVTEKGEIKSAILLGEKATWLEKHAAEELAEYIEQISGAKVEISRLIDGQPRPQEPENTILIGRSETHAAIRELTKAGLLQLSSNYPGRDGYVIKTLSREGKNYLILGGSQDRGTLYAVYHLLENFCQVGFFWDGKRIPTRKTIGFSRIDVAEKPYFPIREHLQGCTFTYTTSHWPWEEWEKELGWMGWKRLNFMMVPRVSSNAADQRPSSKAYREKVITEAHKLGIKFLDPVDHIYPLHPPGESHVLKDWGITNPESEEMREKMVAWGKQEVEKIQKSDPEAAIHISGWGMAYSPTWWPNSTTKAFLDVFPNDKTVVWDLSPTYAFETPNTPLPAYKRLNYFYGKKWAFVVLTTAPRAEALHGNIPRLIGLMKGLANDPKARNCIGAFDMYEATRHNPLYFELFTKLAWNPKKVELEDFLRHYATTRYGEDSVGSMVKCFGELIQSVYSDDSGPTPLYMLALRPNLYSIRECQQRMLRFAYIAHLRKALTHALREVDRQKSNRLYLNDLWDITRSYLRGLIDYHLVQLVSAYLRQEQERFLKEAGICNTLFDYLENLLASRKDLWLEAQIEEGMRIPGVGPKNSVAKYLRGRWKGLGLGDYQRTDRYELFRFQYRRRAEWFIRVLGEKLSKGQKVDYARDLEPAYNQIVKDWHTKPYDLPKKIPGILEVVEGAYNYADGLKNVEAFICINRRPDGPIGWQEDFSDIAGWQMVRGLLGKGGMAESYRQGGGFCFKKRISVKLEKFPILSFRYQVSPNGRYRSPSIWIEWQDVSGKNHRSLVYGGVSAAPGWNIISVDLAKRLALEASPKMVTGIELANVDGIVQYMVFDWIRLSR